MRICFFNTGYCTGISKKISYLTKCWRYLYADENVLRSLVNFISNLNTDVVALTETNSGALHWNLKNQIEYLATASNFPTVVYRKKCASSSLIGKLPFFKNHCDAVLLREGGEKELRFHEFSSGVKRLVIQIKIKPNLNLFVVHLALGKATRTKQIQELSLLIKEFSSNETIVAGDFNIFGGTNELSPLLEKNQLRSVNVKNITTFPSWNPKIQLDFFLVSPGIKIINFEVLQTNISDHLPLLLEIE